MLSFKEILNEDKNTHMEHLEDEIINNGVDGATTVINFLWQLKKMLSGGRAKTNITVKWDGAPAIFAGINPENGKFFIAIKSLFNKTPKINYTNADISANHGSGGPSDKIKLALKYLPELGIDDGVYQGDIMFSNGKGKMKAGTVTTSPNTAMISALLQSGIGYGYHVIHKKSKHVESKKMDAAAMKAAAKVGKCTIYYGGKTGKGKRIDMEFQSAYYEYKLNIRDTQGKDGYPTRMMCDFKTVK